MYLCGIHNFANCVHRKGVTPFSAITQITPLTPRYIFPLLSSIDISLFLKKIEKPSLKKSDKILSQVDIAFVLWYVHCFEKNDTYWLNESWKTRLPKSLKCTIIWGQLSSKWLCKDSVCVHVWEHANDFSMKLLRSHVCNLILLNYMWVNCKVTHVISKDDIILTSLWWFDYHRDIVLISFYDGDLSIFNYHFHSNLPE